MFNHDYELEKKEHPENFSLAEAVEEELEEEDDSDYNGYDQISQD